MEFKSQICTSRSQSEKLLALGLKKETADMYYTNASLPFIKDEFHLECKSFKELSNNLSEISSFTFIPAWSLHRLVEIMFKGDIEGFVGYNIHANNVGIMYEYAISNIEALIKMGTFNKDYLEEKKPHRDEN